VNGPTAGVLLKELPLAYGCVCPTGASAKSPVLEKSTGVFERRHASLRLLGSQGVKAAEANYIVGCFGTSTGVRNRIAEVCGESKSLDWVGGQKVKCSYIKDQHPCATVKRYKGACIATVAFFTHLFRHVEDLG
jgi:hypothetical protein